ncbi:class I SAM-dependent methyltransferase [Mycolicibacterium diernhoferi]|uniref:SAM-dependent methyltransferase n=1 Tax=Mycolicibacterium diernhoferi TaxID=1801 RepID=A0A1Q4H5L4_9MYCO|nr:class I SAM-dependent methyltransferase [Mycolicibacterium diernhoferi]OJZ62850.1 SAM-dependent methyltransferase [Mycolicibacterium diernhoferi]OPE51486.1 SAM-dependent methyltransferase [Mycolicibacterium diernhoferi]PEG55531.1 class I SAM-dependent methyltransferase [Mycolicibacterium diernhoferi]QYL24372.1 class I SAM-dependent methyltransferase [Mycolicibacterium diernhoferi]
MREHFDRAYETRTAPWVIGEPQPAVVALAEGGMLHGRILDIGCGLGEHTILLTGRGHPVLGVDYAPRAIAQARENAATRGVDARFQVGDAMDMDAILAGAAPFDTILDSALFHIFDDPADRARYVAGLHRGCRSGGYLHLLALSDAGRGFGPQVGEEVIRSAFADGWELEALDTTTYRGVVGQAHAPLLGLPVGAVVDEPAWLARIRRL